LTKKRSSPAPIASNLNALLIQDFQNHLSFVHRLSHLHHVSDAIITLSKGKGKLTAAMPQVTGDECEYFGNSPEGIKTYSHPTKRCAGFGVSYTFSTLRGPT
jgi:hypothetical protein